MPVTRSHAFDSDPVPTSVSNSSPVLGFGSGLAFDSDSGLFLDFVFRQPFNSDCATSTISDSNEAGGKCINHPTAEAYLLLRKLFISERGTWTLDTSREPSAGDLCHRCDNIVLERRGKVFSEVRCE
ncbi:hypothetical protein EVAR_80596_1 [Eumeta japonica]|uniref:Uncharacterized protein n=1 Tax=Eumeta variegata TaxID=151549 RepID=A0A4C1TMG3_EUMVA|nr:hypothetical protein EVAR_80596_1 [Eumeta japonica]